MIVYLEVKYEGQIVIRFLVKIKIYYRLLIRFKNIPETY